MNKEHKEKVDAFSGCILVILIMFLLIEIGAVLDEQSSALEAAEYAAIQMKTCESQHQ